MDQNVFKVLTGIRRCGKSVMLELMKEELKERDLDENRFLSVNFETKAVEHWETMVNSCMFDFDVDIYITGSNAKMLSGELAAYLGGRYVEFKIYPFSFGEVLKLM